MNNSRYGGSRQMRGRLGLTPRGLARWCSVVFAPGLLVLAVITLSACSASEDRPQLDLSRASIASERSGATLNVDLHFQPSALQLEALEHGVPLILDLRVSSDHSAPVSMHIGLRYFPLSRRYQLHTGTGGDRSFALRGYLLDALQRLHLPLPHDPCVGVGPCRVEVRFDYSRLPGALRLPALLRSQWRVPVARAEVIRS